MAISLILPNDKLILSAFAAVGQAPGNANLTVHRDFVKTYGVDAYTKALSGILDNAGVTNADLANLVIANFGLSSVAAFTPAFLTSYFQANAANRAAAVINLANIVSNWTGDAAYNSVRDAFNDQLNVSYNYAVVAANTADKTIASFSNQSHTYTLTTALDVLSGTTGADLFNAYIVDNSNTLQSGDVINGGAGIDTLFADIGSHQNFAITAQTTGVENVTIRAQANATGDSKDNNITAQVEIDAQRMNSVSTWTNSNSRADLIIEDVRIADGAKTKDVTIVMESTDPGHVDYAVYFDQHSLRNSSTGNTTLTIELMDTGAAGKAATAATPLLNNPYDQFKIGINGVLSTIQLDKTAVAAADTYEALLTLFQNALTGTGIVATLGGNFTVTDPVSNTQVTGKQILLTGGAGAVISEMPNSGWYNTTGASVPATSNIYTTYRQGSLTQTELVTSTIVLDDVGRGSTGGDLVVGGLSTGLTSTSRGVERFEIEVRDNSKLEHITSTNGALREVTIKNGKTTNTDANQGVYDKTATDAGNLTVLGNALSGAPDTAQTGVKTDPNNNENGNYGFTNVRLIDGSAMTGKLEFDAQITDYAITKYIDLVDTQPNPAGDVAGTGNVNYNVKGANFDYRGGANNDTITVDIDGTVAASRSTIVSGQSDFTFNLEGGAGNDTITVKVVDGLSGGAQFWAANQDLNNNITINAGEGNDVVRIPGAGDVTVNLGAGNDVMYSDNTGSASYGLTSWVNNAQNKAAWVFNSLDQVTTAGVAVRNLNDIRSDSNEVYNFYKATLIVTFKDIPSASITIDSTGYKTSDLQINQAIKNAINNDATLKNLLVAKDGPANSLVVESLIDGVLSTADLSVALTLPTTLSAAEIEGASLAYGTTAAVASANATTGITSLTGAGNLMDLALTSYNTNADYVDQLANNTAGTQLTGAASTSTSDNYITPGEGNDVLVLGTTVGSTTALSSNEVVQYSGSTIGNDVIVNFAATGAGMDYLNFNGVLGQAFIAANYNEGGAIGTFNAAGTDTVGINTIAKQTINIKAIDTTATGNDTAAKVKVLFDAGAGDATVAANAGKHLYVAYTASNVGKVFLITDGAADNDSTVTELGSIDLADTTWLGLDAANYVLPGVNADGASNAYTVLGTAGDDVLNGTALAETINAGLGNDTVTGNGGADTITLGGGTDTLVFNDLAAADTITDYVVADDSIQLSKAVMTGLGALGALAAADFVSGAGVVAGADATDRIAYNTTTGDLYYDADGNGATAAVLIGTFTGAPALVAGEFTIIA